MLTLITFPAGFGEPSISPFCVKAMYLLNLSRQPWQAEALNDPRKAPRAKFPVLRTPHGLVHDSGHIQAYLDENGAGFGTHLSGRDKAHAHSLLRMVEEHLYFIQALDRWERPEVWPTIRDRYFHEIPKILRGFITGGLRRNLMKGLKTQGLGRLTWDERMARVERDLSAISTTLANKPFLFGDQPSTADASVASVLGGMRATPVETPLSRRISEDAQLSAYIDRAAAAMGTS